MTTPTPTPTPAETSTDAAVPTRAGREVVVLCAIAAVLSLPLLGTALWLVGPGGGCTGECEFGGLSYLFAAVVAAPAVLALLCCVPAYLGRHRQPAAAAILAALAVGVVAAPLVLLAYSSMS